MANDRRFEGKVAIITGAGQGIGYGIAEQMAREGAHIVVAEINPETVYKAAEEFSALGPGSMPYLIDIAQVERLDTMVQDVVDRFGRIDILVNNAGVSEKVDFLDITPEKWDRTQRTNQRGLFFCLQSVARQMIRQVPESDRDEDGRLTGLSYGKVVNLSSIAGRRGRANALHYAVSKSATITITQGAAMALAPYRINVNAICPSVVFTPMWDALDRDVSAREGWERGGYFKRRTARIPFQRAGTVEEMATLVTFLCSDAADYITGQTYNIDGGSELN